MINRDKYQLSNPFSRLNGVFTLALVHYCDKYFPFIIAVNQAYGVCQSYAVVRGQAAPGENQAGHMPVRELNGDAGGYFCPRPGGKINGSSRQAGKSRPADPAVAYSGIFMFLPILSEYF